MGVKLSVEVGEALGRMTTKEPRIESLDVQAAIGQGNTVVTPVQLATYAATLANKGVRRTHFVKRRIWILTTPSEVDRRTAPGGDGYH